MRATVLKRPSKSSAKPRTTGGRPPVRRRPRPSHRRAFWLGVGASALLHLVALILASRALFDATFGTAPPGAAAPAHEPATRELRIVRIRPSADAPPLATRIEEREPPLPTTPAPRRTPVPGGVAPRAEPGAVSPVERLAPRMGDPRLWVRPTAPPPPEQSDIERARERVYGRIEALNDSLAAEADAARRATDWTVEKNGKKWGVSPGKIHLGGIELPLPINFSPPPEARDRQNKDAEIRKQGDQARSRESFDDRVKQIRERKEKERKEKSGSGTD